MLANGQGNSYSLTDWTISDAKANLKNKLIYSFDVKGNFNLSNLNFHCKISMSHCKVLKASSS